MTRKTILAVALIIVAILLLIGALTGGHHAKTPQNDAKSDCWAHADKNGSRHCPTVGA